MLSEPVKTGILSKSVVLLSIQFRKITNALFANPVAKYSQLEL